MPPIQPAAQPLPPYLAHPVTEIDWEARNREVETRNLAAAMANSLQENYERKASEVPLKDQDLDTILKHFAGSAILEKVRPVSHLKSTQL